jgi:hypothetical protein
MRGRRFTISGFYHPAQLARWTKAFPAAERPCPPLKIAGRVASPYQFAAQRLDSGAEGKGEIATRRADAQGRAAIFAGSGGQIFARAHCGYTASLSLRQWSPRRKWLRDVEKLGIAVDGTRTD